MADLSHQFRHVASRAGDAFSYEDGNEGAFVYTQRANDAHHIMYGGGFEFDPETKQGHLFSTYRATDPYVHTLMATKGARHAVPALLGMAAEKSLRRYGKLPGVSDSLSPYSSKIVDRLADKGLVEKPSYVHINDYNFDNSQGDVNEGIHNARVHGHLMSNADVHRGQQFTRQMLRKPQETVGGGQGVQQTLF